MTKLLTAAANLGFLLVSGSAQARELRAAVTNGWAGYVVRTDGRSFAAKTGCGRVRARPRLYRSQRTLGAIVLAGRLSGRRSAAAFRKASPGFERAVSAVPPFDLRRIAHRADELGVAGGPSIIEAITS
jgi:hypothetical protein